MNYFGLHNTDYLQLLSEVFVNIPDKEHTVFTISDQFELRSIKLSSIMYKDPVVPVKAETFSGMAAKR